MYILSSLAYYSFWMKLFQGALVYSRQTMYRKNKKKWTLQKIAVIILKLDQYRLTTP